MNKILFCGLLFFAVLGMSTQVFANRKIKYDIRGGWVTKKHELRKIEGNMFVIPHLLVNDTNGVQLIQVGIGTDLFVGIRLYVFYKSGKNPCLYVLNTADDWNDGGKDKIGKFLPDGTLRLITVVDGKRDVPLYMGKEGNKFFGFRCSTYKSSTGNEYVNRVDVQDGNGTWWRSYEDYVEFNSHKMKPRNSIGGEEVIFLRGSYQFPDTPETSYLLGYRDLTVTTGNGQFPIEGDGATYDYRSEWKVVEDSPGVLTFNIPQ